MANLTYKQVINAATQGFRNIQGALANLSDLGLSAVTSSTANGVTTYSGNITPAAMVTSIGHLATIKKSNTSTNNVTDDGTFIKGRVAYRGAGSVTDAITISGTSATLSKTLPAGYYTGITIESSGTIGTGSVSLTGATISASNLDSSGEPANSFKPADVVAKASATASGYSYAKISRAAVTKTVTDGYVTSAQVSGLNSASVSYVKIKNAEYTSTAPTIALSQGLTQKEYQGDTDLGTANLNVIQTTKPSGAHYRVTATPSYSTSATGSATVSVAGYSQQGSAVSGISVGKSSSNEAITRYILKSSIDTSVTGLSNTATLDWSSQSVRVTKGYYPDDRRISINMNEGNVGIAFKNSGNDLLPVIKYYNGSSNSNSLSGILKSDTAGLTRYYTISYTAGVNKTHNTNGYIAGSGGTTSVGTVNLPADTTVYRYIAEASGTLSASVTSNPVVTYSQSQTSGALYALAESSEVTDTGIITNAAYTANNSLLTGDAGTDYWRIEATASQTAGGIKAGVSSSTSGYLDTSRVNAATNGTLKDATNTVQAVLSKATDATFYVKKATLTQDIVGTKSFSTGTPVISVQNGGNVTTGTATTTVPSGYYLAVGTSSTSGTTSLSPKYTATKGGYLPKSTTVTRNAETITATVPASGVTYIPITTGVAHNGYVTTSGWISSGTSYYTTTYDSTEQCVDFIFNN